MLLLNPHKRLRMKMWFYIGVWICQCLFSKSEPITSLQRNVFTKHAGCQKLVSVLQPEEDFLCKTLRKFLGNRLLQFKPDATRKTTQFRKQEVSFASDGFEKSLKIHQIFSSTLINERGVDLDTSPAGGRAPKILRRKGRDLSVQKLAKKLRIKMVIMMPFVPIKPGLPSALHSSGAVYLALETARQNGVLSHIDVDVLWKDTQCQESEALGDSVQLHMSHQVDVFIGPACHSALKAVSLLASYWAVPIMAWFPTEVNLTLTRGHSQLTNLYSSYSEISLAILQVIRQFNWSNIATVRYEDDVFCNPLVDVIRNYYPEYRVNILQDMVISNDIPGILHKYANDLATKARIMLLCSSIPKTITFLRAAQDVGLGDGLYAFIYYNFETQSLLSTLDTSDIDSLSVLRNLLEIGIFSLDKKKYETVSTIIWNHSPAWILNSTNFSDNWKMDDQAVFLHDSVLAYSLALNLSLSSQKMYSRASMTDAIKETTLTGLTGNITLSDDGLRQPQFNVLQYQRHMTVKVATIKARYVEEPGIMVTWPENCPPKDSPECGFSGEFCSSNTDGSDQSAVIVGSVLTASGVLVVLVSFVIYRRLHYERNLVQTSWKIDLSDLKLNTRSNLYDPVGSGSKENAGRRLVRVDTQATLGFGSSCSFDRTQQLFTTIGNYRGTVVAVKKLPYQLKLDDTVLKDLKFLKEVRHQNVNRFIGVHLNLESSLLLNQYCSKGSLQDILENDDIKLDTVFKMSFAMDIARGMSFIHKSTIRSHGNLKSSNCVVDSRWVLSITDFGIFSPPVEALTDSVGTHRYFSNKLWTAPELLRQAFPIGKGTPPGDVYSYGIILYEIFLRTSPFFFNGDVEPDEIIQKVMNSSVEPYRPLIPVNSGIQPSVINLITSCWEESANERPVFPTIRRKLIDINGGKKPNVMDTILKMLETHNSNLESLVTQRTEQLELEQQKMENLLYQLLPRSVAEQLKLGQSVEPESFNECTIFFSDIAGFTAMSSFSTPLQVVDLLNQVYSLFDKIIIKYDVYKVETIGDAYMCVSGIPQPNGNRHAKEICSMALNLLTDVKTFEIPHIPGKQLRLRIGIHSGPCAAGVVGLTMPRYCLFGDTVNMASRLESNGEELRIHISEATNSILLESKAGFMTCPRGFIHLKGKGDVFTYWLIGKECTG